MLYYYVFSYNQVFETGDPKNGRQIWAGGCKIPMYSPSQENADFYTMNTQTGSQMDIPEMFQEGKSTNKFFRCQKLCK